MSTWPIRLLVLEDNDDDAELEIEALRRAGLAPEVTKLGSRSELEQMLATGCREWDVVVSDYMMPDFTGLDALRILREHGVDTAFILVSGTVGEELAVDALHAGADDYILKGTVLARLAASVKRSLREREIARAGARQRAWLDLLARAGRALQESLEVAGVLRAVADVICDATILHCRIIVEGEAITAGDGTRASHVVELPLVARGYAAGTVTFGLARALADDETAFARELAMRVALAIDNARLYEEAQRGIRMRDEFLMVASHEFRTPVMALQLQLEAAAAAAGGGASAEALSERFVRARNATDRIALLVENLLDVSRVAAKELEIAPVDASIDEAVCRVVARLAEQAKRAKSEIVVVSAAPVRARFDVRRIEQVVSNLLDNAIKFGRELPIRVEVHRQGDDAIIRVVDEGIGIPSEKMQAIFGRFERAASTRHYGGLGLGLYIACSIVEAHGGSVAARPREGGGTVIEMTIPIAGPPAR